jgi:uracil-DNA glycosylase
MLTNRAPTGNELEASAHILPMMIDLMDGAMVVAVGRVAHGALSKLGVNAPAVRHPAMGGAEQFRKQIRTLIKV